MTPGEFTQLEQKRIEIDKGYYLTPHRAAQLTKVASTIMKTLTTSVLPVSYAECRYVLDIVNNAIDLASSEDDCNKNADG